MKQLRANNAIPILGALFISLAARPQPAPAQAECSSCLEGESNCIPSDGNVGVGTTSPDWDLEIEKGSAPVSLFLTSDTDQYSGIGFTKGTSNKWYLRTVANGSDLRVYNYTLAIDQMFFEWSTGRVGIGTTTPGALLNVDGNIIADEPTASDHAATKGYVDDRLVIHANTGDSSEEVSTLPIVLYTGSAPYNTYTRVVVYSQELSSVTNDELVQAFSEFEVGNAHNYEVTLGTLIILASSASATTGTEITEANLIDVRATTSNRIATVVKAGSLESPGTGTKYVNVVAYAAVSSSTGWTSGDTLTVYADYGRLSVLRFPAHQ